MDLIIRPQTTLPLESSEVEIVERKGLGHPDTICDALAEQLSIALCNFYQERFGLLLHYNADKVLLWGGIARPAFGGGKVLAPSEIFLAGRATQEFKGVRVPVPELAIESSRNWLRGNFHVLDPEKHVNIHCLLRPGSVDLTELYSSQSLDHKSSTYNFKCQKINPSRSSKGASKRSCAIACHRLIPCGKG